MHVMVFIGISVVAVIGLAILSVMLGTNNSTSRASDKSDQSSDDDSGSGYYLNKVDAMSHGAMVKMGDDDDGPGFYM